MFGLFKRKRPIVYKQWITPLMDFASDTTKFYAAVEDELRKWEVPELTTERILYRDGGLLSQQREYLRVRRENLVFDILSAKFGKCWWFSSRSAVLPRVLRVWEILVFVGGVAAFAASYLYVFDRITAGIAMASTLGMLLVMMVAARTWNGLDDLLLKLPVIGAFYESIFRADSYYRDDARRMYVSIVDHLVREKVKEFAAAEGFDDVQFNNVSDIQQLTSLTERMTNFVVQAAAQVAAKSK